MHEFCDTRNAYHTQNTEQDGTSAWAWDKYEKDPDSCSTAEKYAVKFLIPKIHKGAQALFTKRDLTDTARKFMRETSVNSMGSIKAVFMDNGGITTDGSLASALADD